MTPGPARPIVTVLPSNKPTPIALPIAIMAIWRGMSFRFSPSSVDVSISRTARILQRVVKILAAPANLTKAQQQKNRESDVRVLDRCRLRWCAGTSPGQFHALESFAVDARDAARSGDRSYLR